MKQVLIPTDFSDYALNAFFMAVKLQHKTPCNFTLLHTYEPDKRNTSNLQNSSRAGIIYDGMYQNALDQLEDTLITIAKVSDYTQHTFSVKAKSGDLATVINELVAKLDLDMIVMGTKGATGAKQVFLGSNAVKVLKKIHNCPVLVVPRKFNFQSLKKIVFPTEYGHFFSKNQLDHLVRLADTWQSQLLVFHVAQEFKISEQQLANKKILKERLSNIKHSFFKVTIHTTVAEAITEFTKEQSAQMICMVHYGHTFMEKLTQEPVVKKVGFHTEVPLLVLPE